MIIVASFFTPRDHPWCQIFPYIELLRLQRASCERFGIRQVVLSDDRGAEVLRDFETFVSPLPDSLMQASLHAQRNYLKHLVANPDQATGDLMLIDADCIVGKDPAPVFDETFDIGVTVFPFRDSILNNGAIYLGSRAATLGLGLPFWENAIGRVSGDHWGDDQAALRDAFEATLDLGVQWRRGVRVQQFSCVGYNQAPDHPLHDPDTYVVHFRGSRKQFAHFWAQRYLNLDMKRETS